MAAALCAPDGTVASADVLVDNAGLQHVAPLEDLPPEPFALILRVMVQVPFELVRAALPHRYAQGWGRVLNVSSGHGLEGLSKAIALEGGGRGVTSDTLCPATCVCRSSRARSPRRQRFSVSPRARWSSG